LGNCVVHALCNVNLKGLVIFDVLKKHQDQGVAELSAKYDVPVVSNEVDVRNHKTIIHDAVDSTVLQGGKIVVLVASVGIAEFHTARNRDPIVHLIQNCDWDNRRGGPVFWRLSSLPTPPNSTRYGVLLDARKNLGPAQTQRFFFESSFTVPSGWIRWRSDLNSKVFAFRWQSPGTQ
jgi:hypothetical protein